MARYKDGDWQLPSAPGTTKIASWDHVKIAVLMDIRDELKQLNRLLGCPNFTEIPSVLREIRRNTAKPKPKPKPKPKRARKAVSE